MTKNEFIESVEEIVTDEIFITSRTDLIDEEISNNMWRISIDDDTASQLLTEELMNLTKRIKANRQEQISKSMEDVDLIFYMWHDAQASQLRFNFINSNHEKLPFESTINLVESESIILDEFLNDAYHNGIPFSELKEIQKNESSELSTGEELGEIVLKVYKEIIKVINEL